MQEQCLNEMMKGQVCRHPVKTVMTLLFERSITAAHTARCAKEAGKMSAISRVDPELANSMRPREISAQWSPRMTSG